MSVAKTSVQHLPRVRTHTLRKTAFVPEQQAFGDRQQNLKKKKHFHFVEMMFLISGITKGICNMEMDSQRSC